MTDDLAKRLDDINRNYDLARGVHSTIRDAKARIEALTAERNKAVLGNHRFNEHEPTWAELADFWKARDEKAEAERDRLRDDLEELDFLRHEGGPDSVAAIEAERDRLREALEQIAVTCQEEIEARTAGMSERGLKGYRILALLQLPRDMARAALTGRGVMPPVPVNDATHASDIGPGDQGKVAGAALPTVDELAQIIRTVDGNHSLGAGELAERILSALAQKRDSHE